MDPETPKTKTVTARQLAANRANARKSTGPRTRQGKLRSAYNRLEHGLAAATVVLPGEDAERFDWLRQETMEIFAPANAAETQLASLFAAAQWRCERAVLYETAVGLEGRAKWDREIKSQYPGVSEPLIDGLIFGRRATAPEDRTLQCLDRYHQRSLNMLAKTYRLLRDIQRDRLAGQIAGPAAGAGSPEPMDPWPHPLPDRVAPEGAYSENPPTEPIPNSGHPAGTTAEPDDSPGPGCAHALREEPPSATGSAETQVHENPPTEPIPDPGQATPASHRAIAPGPAATPKSLQTWSDLSKPKWTPCPALSQAASNTRADLGSLSGESPERLTHRRNLAAPVGTALKGHSGLPPPLAPQPPAARNPHGHSPGTGIERPHPWWIASGRAIDFTYCRRE